MAGASQYPKLIDTDTQLLRRAVTDVIVPVDHNNLVDAIQSVEQTLGGVDDGTTGGGAQAFTTGAAHVAGLVSTAMPNPRFPFLPLSSISLYGTKGSLPVGWVLDSGSALNWTQAVGLVKVTPKSSANYAVLKVPIPATLPQDVVIHGWFNEFGQPSQLGFVFDTVADPIMDGVELFTLANPGQTQFLPILDGSPQSNTIGPTSYHGDYIYFHADGTHLDIYLGDGSVWGPRCWRLASTAPYTQFAIIEAAISGGVHPFWIDFIAFGSGLLPGAL